jgi:hypothetical protein
MANMIRALCITAAIVRLCGWHVAGQSGVPMRTPWGEPDIQGVFTTDDELGVPFERPDAMGTRTMVTDQEFADREAQATRPVTECRCGCR